MNDLIEYVTLNYRTLAENDAIDRNELVCMIEDIYNMGFEDGRSEGYDEGYNDCLDDNHIED